MAITFPDPIHLASSPDARGQPALARFVLLSLLLHAAIVLIFGTSQGTGAGRGDRSLDVLDVTLGRSVRPGAGAQAPPAFEQRAMTRPADRALSGPSAAPAAPPPAPEAVPRALPPEPMPPIDLQAMPRMVEPLPPVIAAPPTLERLAPSRPMPGFPAPFEVAPRTAPMVPSAPVERIAAPPISRELAPPVRLPSAEIVPVAPIERLAAPVSRALVPPAELPAPAVQIAPTTTVERLAAPAVSRELAPPLELPAPAAQIAPAAPVERLAAPPAPHPLAPPVELAPPTAPVATPAPIDRLAAPVLSRQLAPAATVATPEAPAAPSAQPRQEPGPIAPPPAGGASASEALPRLRLGAPPGEDIFKPRQDVVVPSAEPGGEPHIDMNAARARAREIASEQGGVRGLVPALPPPPERKSKEALALEKAIKPDCRTAYASLGLLAAVPLLASAIGEGCNW